MSLIKRLASWTPWQLLWVFSLVNLVNNIDRGIIPGAFENISRFIRESTGSEDTDALLGMTVGLCIWVASCILSGVSPSYASLAAARVLSGVGEASFHCVVPPFIDSTAPAASRGTWLAIYYLAGPVGQALGFAWGGVLGSSPLTWRGAFLLEFVPVALCMPLLWVTPYYQGRLVGGGPVTREEDSGILASAGGISVDAADFGSIAPSSFSASPTVTDGLGELPGDQPRGSGDASAEPSRSHSHVQIASPRPRPTFWTEVRITLGSPLFLLITFGYAGWFAVISGLASFGPAFTDGLGMFTSQSVASVTLGASIAAAGIVGTPIGGWLLDWEVNRRWKRVQSAQSVTEGVSVSSSGLPVADQEDGASSTAAVTSCPHEKEEVVPEALLALRLQVAMRQSFLLTVAGTIMCFFAVAAALSGPGLFMFFLSIGFALLLANTSALAVATMACVPAETRAFAIGLNTLMIHAFGDVPSPPLIGLVADTLSPKSCLSTGDEYSCTRNAGGLQTTMGLVVLWLAWPCLLWLVAWGLVERRSKGAAAATHAKRAVP